MDQPANFEDIPDDLIPIIATALCGSKVYSVWNVLARVNTRYSTVLETAKADFITKFDHVEKEGPGGRITSYYRGNRLYRENDLPTMVIDDNSVVSWHVDGKLHRGGDLPAVVSRHYGKFWRQHGVLCRPSGEHTHELINGTREWSIDTYPSRNDTSICHREGDLPAVIHPDGTCEWRHLGNLHRGGDKPAIVRANRTLEWFIGGKPHRDGDEPAVIDPTGYRAWYHKGMKLREIERDGTQKWYWKGKLHRPDKKPAVIRPDGSKEYHFNGKPMPDPDIYQYEIEEYMYEDL